MDLLRQGSAWLERTRAQFAAQCVAYRRASSSVTVRATIGRTHFEYRDDSGLITSSESRDYLILACELSLDDLPVTPLPGDQVIEGGLSCGVIYEVMQAPTGEPCWRWSDPYRKTYRIHTRYVGVLPSTF